MLVHINIFSKLSNNREILFFKLKNKQEKEDWFIVSLYIFLCHFVDEIENFKNSQLFLNNCPKSLCVLPFF